MKHLLLFSCAIPLICSANTAIADTATISPVLAKPDCDIFRNCIEEPAYPSNQISIHHRGSITDRSVLKKDAVLNNNVSTDRLSAADRQVLESAVPFQKILTTTKLPPAILKLFADRDGKVADPGQDWGVGCTGSLPHTRLIWAAVKGNYYIMHYERGGIAYSSAVMIATLTPQGKKPKIIWERGVSQVQKYPVFIKTLQSGSLNVIGRSNYSYR